MGYRHPLILYARILALPPLESEDAVRTRRGGQRGDEKHNSTIGNGRVMKNWSNLLLETQNNDRFILSKQNEALRRKEEGHVYRVVVDVLVFSDWSSW